MSAQSARNSLICSLFDTFGRGLEIGPSYNPIVPKRSGFNVEIVDHASTADLRAKYANEPHVDVSLFEEVDHIWDGRPLSQVVGSVGRYDYIVASHVIEHMPDLLGFVKECELLLSPSGVLVLAVPDKRRCFDVFRPLSSTGSVLEAHLHKRSRHTPATAFDHVAYFANMNGVGGWSEGATGHLSLDHSLDFADAIFQRSATSTEYYDFHAWVFTPSSFRLILRDLHEIGALGLKEAAFQPTAGIEFLMTLSRLGDGCPLPRTALLAATHQELLEYPEQP